MFKRLLSKCTAVAVFLIIATALLFSLVRLLLPVAGQYRSDIEGWINRSVGQSMVIGSLEAQWRGVGPSLKLTGVQMRDAEQQPVALFEEVNIDIDVVSSLLHGRVEPGQITISGVNLSVVRRPDGTFVVAGIAGSAETDSALMRDWLFSRKGISIEKSRVHWRDMKKNTPPMLFRDVSFTFHNQGDRHFLSGKLSLPPGMGRGIEFAADITGNFLDAQEWDGEIYLKGSGLVAKEWLGGSDLRGVVVSKGVVDIASWSQWRQANPVSAQGEIRVLDLHLGERPRRGLAVHNGGRFSNVSGRFNWQRSADAWSVDVDRFVIARNGRAWLPTRLHFGVSNSDGHLAIEAGSTFLRVQDISSVLLLGDLVQGDLRSALIALQPHGDLSDFAFRHSEASADKAYFVQAHFTDVSAQPWKYIPGVRGMAGTLRADQDSGVVTIDARHAGLNVKKLFRDTWAVEKVVGTFEWQRDGQRWHAQSNDWYIKNPDIEGRVNAALDWQEGKAPFLDLVASVSRGNIAKISSYLPAHIMPPRVGAWLDDAIEGGRIASGGVVFRGAVNEFPFDKHQGTFEARAQVVDGILDYAPQWPRLTQIQAEVIASGKSLEINAEEAKILRAHVLPTRAIIPDLTAEPAVLTVTGNAFGSTDDALRFLTETPLGKHQGKLFEHAVAQGSAELDLTLVLPLSSAPAKVDGVLMLSDSKLNLQDVAEIDEINGVVRFTDNGLVASGMKAQLYGQQARIDIRREEGAGGPMTVIQASGKANAENLAKQFLPSLQSSLKGNSDWLAKLKISSQGDDTNSIDLRLESSMQGISINLPEPFGKPAFRLQKLTMDLALPLGGDNPIRLRFGDNVSGIFDLKRRNSKTIIERGELRFGGESAQLPSQPGLRVAGQLTHFSKREWDNIGQTALDKHSALSDVAFRWIDLRIDELEVMGNIFSVMSVKAEKFTDAWVVDVSGEQAVGRMRVPHSSIQPITLDFERLFLEANGAPTGKQPATDPRQLPPLQLKSRQFKFNGFDLGSLSLTASKIPDGLKFTDFTAISPHTRIRAHGEWTMAAKLSSTSLNMVMDSDDVGSTLSTFGYVDSIKNGKSHSEMTVQWVGPPSAFALKDIDGVLQIKIEDGRVLDVDPGAGRIFGLLSLQALPRRLTLDFSDLFAKGFSFDKTEGKFTIENGNAFIDSLFMDGPAARIDVTGRIGLAKRDYDQRVTVTPHITSSLPLAIGVLASPAAGAAAWLAEKLIGKPLGAMARAKYSVTGSWDKPVVELLSNSKQKKQNRDEDN